MFKEFKQCIFKNKKGAFFVSGIRESAYNKFLEAVFYDFTSNTANLYLDIFKNWNSITGLYVYCLLFEMVDVSSRDSYFHFSQWLV